MEQDSSLVSSLMQNNNTMQNNLELLQEQQRAGKTTPHAGSNSNVDSVRQMVEQQQLRGQF